MTHKNLPAPLVESKLAIRDDVDELIVGLEFEVLQDRTTLSGPVTMTAMGCATSSSSSCSCSSSSTSCIGVAEKAAVAAS